MSDEACALKPPSARLMVAENDLGALCSKKQNRKKCCCTSGESDPGLYHGRVLFYH
jgi:hypothetical protein